MTLILPAGLGAPPSPRSVHAFAAVCGACLSPVHPVPCFPANAATLASLGELMRGGVAPDWRCACLLGRPSRVGFAVVELVPLVLCATCGHSNGRIPPGATVPALSVGAWRLAADNENCGNVECPVSLPLCKACVAAIGGACSGPESRWRPLLEDVESCGAADCAGDDGGE